MTGRIGAKVVTGTGRGWKASRKWFGRHPLAVVPLLLVPIVASIFGARWAVDRVTGESGFFTQSEGLYAGMASVEDAVQFSDLIVVVRVVGEPTDRTLTSGASSVLQKGVEAEVQQLLVGDIGSTLTVFQNYENKEGAGPTTREEHYAPLRVGETYVLFLAADSRGAWIPVGVPLGFEADDGQLSSLDDVAPEDWGLRTLDDLSRAIEAALAPASG
jgi:hypothetical protein